MPMVVDEFPSSLMELDEILSGRFFGANTSFLHEGLVLCKMLSKSTRHIRRLHCVHNINQLYAIILE
jgi:hypothetical protein